MDLRDGISATAGINPKLFIYHSGLSAYGFGASASSLDYDVPAGAGHNFFVNGVLQAGVSVKGTFLRPITVATLPTCGGTGAAAGTYQVVNDATSSTFGAVVAGGGGITTPLFCNGSSWTMH